MGVRTGARARRTIPALLPPHPQGVEALRAAREVMDRMWARVRGHPRLREA